MGFSEKQYEKYHYVSVNIYIYIYIYIYGGVCVQIWNKKYSLFIIFWFLVKNINYRVLKDDIEKKKWGTLFIGF